MTNRDRVLDERKVFAQLIGNIVASGAPVIYMDETTFTAWMLKSKSWSSREKPVYHARNDKKFGTTVFGALGRCLKNGFVYQRAKSTNKIDFLRFVIDTRQAVQERYWNQKPYFLYDGHPAHVGRDRLRLLEQYFRPVQIPGYSCEFNCKCRDVVLLLHQLRGSSQ